MQTGEEFPRHTEVEEELPIRGASRWRQSWGVDSLGTCKWPEGYQGREPRQLSWVYRKRRPAPVIPNHERGKGTDRSCRSLNANANTETPVIRLEDDPTYSTGWPNGEKF